jgi:hypothetical protein
VTVYRRNPLLMTVLGANPGVRYNPLDKMDRNKLYERAKSAWQDGIDAAKARRRTGYDGLEAAMAQISALSMAAKELGAEKLHFAISHLHNDLHEAGAQAGLWASFFRGHRSPPKEFFENPIGEALLAGATSAVVSHALQSNPSFEGGPCAACGGSLAYQGTLGNREHYRCRDCGLDFNTPVTHRRRFRGWKKTCGHGFVTNQCKICRGRRVDPRIKPCPHGIAGGGVRCVACQRLFRRGGPVQNNPAIQKSWDGLKTRQRLAILEFAGISEDRAIYLSGKSWERLGEIDPSARAMVMKGWRDSSRPTRGTGTRRRHETTVRMNPYGLRPKHVKVYCQVCGNWTQKYKPFHVAQAGSMKGKRMCDLCYRGWRQGRAEGASWAQNPQPNPGSKRRMTMTVEKFAQWVKAKRDPTMWKAFLAKFRGYEKWTHGAKAKKVTVEWVDTPGVNGLWITYDGGKQPESTYIMPKGVPRKGAWKHPWDTMPDIKHDPEAKIVITKLRGQSKITDFYHK